MYRVYIYLSVYEYSFRLIIYCKLQPLNSIVATLCTLLSTLFLDLILLIEYTPNNTRIKFAMTCVTSRRKRRNLFKYIYKRSA